MESSRRHLLLGAAAGAVGAATLGKQVAVGAAVPLSTETIAELFAGLPGTFAFKVFAPATGRTEELDLSLNAGEQLFVASAVKVFMAVEALRQVDAPDVVTTVDGQQLSLDASVWTVGSPTLNPRTSPASCRSEPPSMRWSPTATTPRRT